MRSRNLPSLPPDLPVPHDDGAADHLVGRRLPPISSAATDGTRVTLAMLPGRVVVFAYPRTGQPGQPSLVADRDLIPGARGRTSQTCAFRDLHAEFVKRDCRIFGPSTQESAYQREMAERLHLPFPVLSDTALELTQALRLPTMEIAGLTLLKRLARVADAGVIGKVFYPDFPPDRNAETVLTRLRSPEAADRR